MSKQVSIDDLVMQEIEGRVEMLIEKEDREYEEILVNGTRAIPRMGIIGTPSNVVTTEGAEPTDR